MSSTLKKSVRGARLASRIRFKLKQRRNNRPRLSVFCSNQHIYAQIIDDVNGVTLVSASTMGQEFKTIEKKSNVEAASKIGALIAKKAKEVGVCEVVFDRGNKLYHGKVKALADAARTILSF